MGASFHRLVQSDLNRILRDYEGVSDALADDFYREFMEGVGEAVENPRYFHFDASGLRRYNLRRFPFRFLYDISLDGIRIWVLRHERRKPSLGTRRFKR
ncbi:MAG: hypothetical protein RLZZ505_2351 [Verrucomicrobiota bacterium]|jgi:hypothetical protein